MLLLVEEEHTSYILKKISKGRVYAFDQDKDAHANKINDKRLKLIHANFRYLKNFFKVQWGRKN